jgi:hypothetical protein
MVNKLKERALKIIKNTKIEKEKEKICACLKLGIEFV